jgi:hypothetical protein
VERQLLERFRDGEVSTAGGSLFQRVDRPLLDRFRDGEVTTAGGSLLQATNVLG